MKTLKSSSHLRCCLMKTLCRHNFVKIYLTKQCRKTLKKYTNSDTKNTFRRKYTHTEVNIDMVLLYDWKGWRIGTNNDNSHHKEKKWCSKYYPIMYLTWSSKCFINYFLFYLFIRVSKYSKASCEIKKTSKWLQKFIYKQKVFAFPQLPYSEVICRKGNLDF